MPDLLFFLLLGHIVGDFALQSDRMAATKGDSKAVLAWHVTVYTVCIALSLWLGLYFNGQSNFFSLMTPVVLASLWVVHWLQDLTKVSHFNGTKQAFFVDQAIHLLQLYVIRIFIYHV